MTEKQQENSTRIDVSWVCAPCGKIHGTHVQETLTWHIGRCDVCGKTASVTAGRNYGVYMIDPLGEFE